MCLVRLSKPTKAYLAQWVQGESLYQQQLGRVLRSQQLLHSHVFWLGSSFATAVAYPLTPLVVTPSMKVRWVIKNNTTIGNVISTDPAIRRCVSDEYALINCSNP